MDNEDDDANAIFTAAGVSLLLDFSPSPLRPFLLLPLRPVFLKRSTLSSFHCVPLSFLFLSSPPFLFFFFLRILRTTCPRVCVYARTPRILPLCLWRDFEERKKESNSILCFPVFVFPLTSLSYQLLFFFFGERLEGGLILKRRISIQKNWQCLYASVVRNLYTFSWVYWQTWYERGRMEYFHKDF